MQMTDDLWIELGFENFGWRQHKWRHKHTGHVYKNDEGWTVAEVVDILIEHYYDEGVKGGPQPEHLAEDPELPPPSESTSS